MLPISDSNFINFFEKNEMSQYPISSENVSLNEEISFPRKGAGEDAKPQPSKIRLLSADVYSYNLSNLKNISDEYQNNFWRSGDDESNGSHRGRSVFTSHSKGAGTANEMGQVHLGSKIPSERADKSNEPSCLPVFKVNQPIDYNQMVNNILTMTAKRCYSKSNGAKQAEALLSIIEKNGLSLAGDGLFLHHIDESFIGSLTNYTATGCEIIETHADEVAQAIIEFIKDGVPVQIIRSLWASVFVKSRIDTAAALKQHLLDTKSLISSCKGADGFADISLLQAAASIKKMHEPLAASEIETLKMLSLSKDEMTLDNDIIRALSSMQHRKGTIDKMKSQELIMACIDQENRLDKVLLHSIAGMHSGRGVPTQDKVNTFKNWFRLSDRNGNQKFHRKLSKMVSSMMARKGIPEPAEISQFLEACEIPNGTLEKNTMVFLGAISSMQNAQGFPSAQQIKSLKEWFLDPKTTQQDLKMLARSLHAQGVPTAPILSSARPEVPLYAIHDTDKMRNKAGGIEDAAV
ncbi:MULTISPECIES: hypothetical protein [unclassified Caballeronia]|uniref:hypothetical protein n=1 Tax=unclassified Caballeronia TaxID=2646786 RepID=UPI00202889C7|nr:MULTISPECIES: hypothetical protein [unclassified Caballeronia]